MEDERASQRLPARADRSVGVLLALWTGAVASGFCALFAYAAEPGPMASVPSEWPTASALVRDAERATLLVFVHPHCACSRASLAELERTLARVPGRASTLVVMVRPEGAPSGWAVGELRERASRIPSVTIVDDDRAIEATRFGALTSGTTLLYDADGHLAFAGGLTESRGHEGDSFGQERIVLALTSGDPDRRDSPVFGCALGRAAERASP